jgi:Lon protease-like protein
MTDPAGESSSSSSSSRVPLFPLPNVVLFPRVVMPLHIFEDRYRQMTADVLRGDKRVAMALLRPGWEKDYYGRPAIEPVVCVGQILSHERLPDGRYNFLLQGERRARVIAEERGPEGRLYRVARVETLDEVGDTEDHLSTERSRLARLFERGAYANLPGGQQVRRMLADEVPTAVIADLLAFLALGDDQVALKQELLADPDVKRRVGRTVEALAALSPEWRNAPADARMN